MNRSERRKSKARSGRGDSRDGERSAQAPEIAMQRHQTGDLAGARAAYNAILADDPKNYRARFLVGALDLQLGRIDDAIDNLNAALRLRSRFPEALNNLGLAQQARGDVDAAVAAFRKAIGFNRDFADVHLNLGNLYMEMQRPDEAAASFRRALALRPGDVDTLFGLGTALMMADSL